MGLLNIISKSLADYISLADLIAFLSEHQNETIHDIALYLSHYNFFDTPNYSITIDNKFYKNGFDSFGNDICWIEPKKIIDNLIKEFVFFDTTVSREMMVEMTFSKIKHYLSKMDGVEINNKQYLAIEQLYRANVHYKKSDLLELDFLAEYLQDNQEFKEWKTSYIRPFSYYDNQWYITEPANEPTDLQQENERLQARIAELEQKLAMQNTTPADVEKPIYTNTALTALFDVMNTYWQNPEQPPKQEFIKQWIVEKYPSIDPSKALWIDKIIRHQDRK